MRRLAPQVWRACAHSHLLLMQMASEHVLIIPLLVMQMASEHALIIPLPVMQLASEHALIIPRPVMQMASEHAHFIPLPVMQMASEHALVIPLLLRADGRYVQLFQALSIFDFPKRWTITWNCKPTRPLIFQVAFVRYNEVAQLVEKSCFTPLFFCSPFQDFSS